MERFCVEIAIHFLRQWLLHNWSDIVSYAWEISCICMTACDARGMRVSQFHW